MVALKLKRMNTKNIGARHNCKDMADIGDPGLKTQNKTKNGYGSKTKMDAGQGKFNQLYPYGTSSQKHGRHALHRVRSV